MRRGGPFSRVLRAKGKVPSFRTVKTYEDCLFVAEACGGSYGVRAGWLHCVWRIIPAVPPSFLIGARSYKNCTGLAFARSDSRLVFAFDEGSYQEEIEVERIPWGVRLSPVAELWLASYDRWLADGSAGACSR